MSPPDAFFPVDLPEFRRRYPPAVRRPRALHTERVGSGLRARLGDRSVLGLAFYRWHDQLTLWWFEQGMLSLLAAAGWPTTWVTDARYEFDTDRLAELNGNVTIARQRDVPEPSEDRGDPWTPPAGRFDTVITLFPGDRATRAARVLGARLVTFAIKNLHEDEPTLREAPPPGTPLWHAFAGSTNFFNQAFDQKTHQGVQIGKLGTTAPAWRLSGAPFPTNRYYFPVRRTQPEFDALLLGSKSRDRDTAFAALARVGVTRIAVLADSEHVDEMAQAARRHGIDAAVYGPLSHIDMLALLEQSRLIVNPIMLPAESHYSMSVPLAVGRPIVATDLPSVRPFAGPGVLLAPPGDVPAWGACIARFLDETAESLPHRPALKQSLERHDLDLFFGSAILSTLSDGTRTELPD